MLRVMAALPIFERAAKSTGHDEVEDDGTLSAILSEFTSISAAPCYIAPPAVLEAVLSCLPEVYVKAVGPAEVRGLEALGAKPITAVEVYR
jgi:hypothetical protein